ncbi:MAG: hypothetical protein ACFFBP_09195 [Promethearchaeota archaeon]
MVDSKEAQIFFVGSVITSLVAAILMIATDFGSWYITGWGYGWIEANATITGGIIIFIISLFFICFTISIIALIKSDLLPDIVYLIGLYVAITILILTIIGASVFVVEMVKLDPTNWWFGASFYGALIGSILTTIFFILALIKMELSFIPKF